MHKYYFTFISITYIIWHHFCRILQVHTTQYTLMKNLFFYLLVFLPLFSVAQPGYINTIIGNGSVGYGGDGGLATAASLYYPFGVCVDPFGNIYVSGSHYVRKVSPNGIITNFAGGGTSNADGILAVSSSLISPLGICSDAFGNIYISDGGTNKVRKVAPNGIITTVAGNGTAGYSGDGGPATQAKLKSPWGIFVDHLGNLYICDFSNQCIRKVNTLGIITTIAGTGFSGFSGDGGPAINAQLFNPQAVYVDINNNVYIADYNNGRIRKINSSGIINTFAGNGTTSPLLFGSSGIPAISAAMGAPSGVFMDGNGNVYIADDLYSNLYRVDNSGTIYNVNNYTSSGFAGDSGLVVSAMFNDPRHIWIDECNNIYIADEDNMRVRKIGGHCNFTNIADSFSISLNNNCQGPDFLIVPNAYSTALYVKTFFGDGQSRTDSFVTSSQASFSHSYYYSGVYTIKNVLYSYLAPIDSISYSYSYSRCLNIPMKLFNDLNNNGIYDSTSEPLLFTPSLFEVDSNGISIDTISIVSGYNYLANANVGDVYQFKLLSTALGLTPSTPSSGIIIDTLANVNSTKYIGFHCSGNQGYDFTTILSSNTRANFQKTHIIVNNNSCLQQNGILMANYSPKYTYFSANIIPSIISNHTISWNISNLSSTNASPLVINYTLHPIGASQLIVGDTVNSISIINPISGDNNPGNNTCAHNDTVKSSYDPNEMSVSPSGYIPASSTQLTYTFEFENTGNDTAQNIYVLDTISNFLDIHSLSLVAASHTMITSKVFNGTNWVMKFDFPNIKLLDSSHHNQCTGLAIFTIKTKPGLANGTVIPNRAGIYFDDNPVVLTNTVTDIIGTPSGITQVSAANVAPHIYPNPAHNELHIEGTDIHSVEITNLLGQVVLSSYNTSTSTTLNIESLQSGIYFVRVNGLYPYRLIKE